MGAEPDRGVESGAHRRVWRDPARGDTVVFPPDRATPARSPSAAGPVLDAHRLQADHRERHHERGRRRAGQRDVRGERRGQGTGAQDDHGGGRRRLRADLIGGLQSSCGQLKFVRSGPCVAVDYDPVSVDYDPVSVDYDPVVQTFRWTTIQFRWTTIQFGDAKSLCANIMDFPVVVELLQQESGTLKYGTERQRIDSLEQHL